MARFLINASELCRSRFNSEEMAANFNPKCRRWPNGVEQTERLPRNLFPETFPDKPPPDLFCPFCPPQHTNTEQDEKTNEGAAIRAQRSGVWTEEAQRVCLETAKGAEGGSEKRFDVFVADLGHGTPEICLTVLRRPAVSAACASYCRRFVSRSRWRTHGELL